MEKYGVKISYSWGDEESVIEAGDKDAAWNLAVELAGKEAAEAGLDNDSPIELYFGQDMTQIVLRYEYDDSYCYYDIVPMNGNTKENSK